MRWDVAGRWLQLAMCAGWVFVVACAGEESNSEGGGGSGGAGTTSGLGGEGGSGGDPCTPGTEICDGKDNDCDKQIDEVPGGCACNDGQVQDCYTGPRGTENVGVCVHGTQTCEAGQWSACEDEVLPGTESCNTLDDDCNGDEDDMGQTMCGVGACMATVDTCVNGQTQQCVPGQPGLEVCDGIDNNCNQLVDESDPVLNQACDSGLLGVCQAGTNQCINAAIDCVPNQMAGSEACDSLDNDCDGTVDNNVPGTGGACNTGQFGVCASGTVSCQGGTVDCFPNTPPSAEICDLVDNDCNGQVDEDDPQMGNACMTGQPGVCAAGSIDCNGGMLQCVPNALSSPEICNGIDDDCDGTPDDGNPGGGQACGCGGSGTTACVNGSVVCQGGPATYFSEDFSDNSAGWTLGPEWGIAPAAASAGCGFGNDPSTDHTATADNGVAGVLIGGCYGTSLHTDYCITSPSINTSAAVGQMFFSYWRHLHTDYPNYISSHVDVSNNGGSSWTVLYSVPAGVSQNDSAWTQASYDITAYKSATTRVRFCYSAGPNTGIITGGGWNIDDVAIASQVCP